VSFWRYRFPEGAPRLAAADELLTIFQDFAHNFGLDPKVHDPAAIVTA
jgi:hypothetical protein